MEDGIPGSKRNEDRVAPCPALASAYEVYQLTSLQTFEASTQRYQRLEQTEAVNTRTLQSEPGY